jgi:hypothetical protein
MPQEREVTRAYRWKPLASRRIDGENDLRKGLQRLKIKN